LAERWNVGVMLVRFCISEINALVYGKVRKSVVVKMANGE
jgi:hypothetical protein